MSRELVTSRLAAAAAGAFALLVGTVVLVGWALDVDVLKSVLPGLVTMKANTALALCALGLSLLLAALPESGGEAGIWLARALAVVAAMLALITLTAYMAGWGVTFDQLLFFESRGQPGTAIPGRMAPDSAAALLLCAIGVGLATLPARMPRAMSQALGALSMLLALRWLVRYALGQAHDESAIFTAMALHSALALFVLGLGLVALGAREMFHRPAGGVEVAAQAAPWALLLLAGLGSQLLWWSSVERSAADVLRLYEDEVTQVRAQVDDGMRRYELLLRAAAAMLQTWSRVDRESWRRFVVSLDIAERYPGMQGLGYVALLTPAQVPRFEQARRAEGLHGFAIWPRSPRAQYSAITYIEPLDQRNRRALGFDMMSEQTRREAMHRARDTGAPALSGRVRLLQESDVDPQAGILLYMPLYRDEPGLRDVESRRAALTGYVYSPFRANNLIESIVPSNRMVAVEVYDGSPGGERTLLSRSVRIPRGSSAPLLLRDESIEVSGRQWTLRVSSQPLLEARIDRRLPVSVLLTSTAAALMFFGVAWMLAEQRLRAERSARESQSALRETEISFRAMIDAVQDYAIFQLDPDGRIATWNRGAERIKGYPANEVIGRHFSLFYPREYVERGKPGELLAQARRAPVADEGWRVRKDGSWFWASTIITPVMSPEGVLTGFVKVTRDNTALMEAEQTLRNANVALDLRVRERTRDLAIANERYELAVRGSNDGLWDWDVASGSVYYSPRFQELLEYPPGSGEFEQTFAAFEARLHPEDRDGVLAAVDAHLKQRSPYDIEYRLRTRSGEYRWYRARGQAVWDDAGKPLRMAGSITDVTQRRQAEEALRKSEAQLQAIIDNSPAVIYVKDLDGRYLLINRQFETLFHVNRADVRGRTDHDYFPHDMADEFRRNDRDVVSRNSVVEAEESAPVDGVMRTYLSVKFPLADSAGRVYATCGISTDITERKGAEDRLKAFAARLEASNRELEEFARVASHDLQEPLRKVASFAERLEAKYAHALDDQGRDYLARMTDATRRMGRLIGDLLNYSRVTTRAQPFQKVDLGEVVRDVISDLEVRIEESGARIEVGELQPVLGDRMQLQQLLQNLIGNALKFIRPDSEPCVRIASKVDATDGQRFCVLSVSDNGIGFDQQYAERIFGVFQRLHGRTEYEGSGVGLAICRKIVERHGGSIDATGVPGEGAVFTVRLPVFEVGGSDT